MNFGRRVDRCAVVGGWTTQGRSDRGRPLTTGRPAGRGAVVVMGQSQTFDSLLRPPDRDNEIFVEQRIFLFVRRLLRLQRAFTSI